MTETEQPPRPGRRSMLTDERQQRIVDAVRAGNYLKVAAQWAGVGESTLLGWLARGRTAVKARDAHPEGRLFCPSCDRDRTDEHDAVEQANYREQQRHEREVAAWQRAQADDAAPLPENPPEPEPRAFAVLDRCPDCGSGEPPAAWQLDDAEAAYVEFLEQVTRAETSAEVAAVTAWRSAFTEDWRAARDYLVRRRPDRWAATTRIQMSTEEAERRIDDAVAEALTALGVDHELPPAGELDDDLAEVDDPMLDLDLDLDADAGGQADDR